MIQAYVYLLFGRDLHSFGVLSLFFKMGGPTLSLPEWQNPGSIDRADRLTPNPFFHSGPMSGPVLKTLIDSNHKFRLYIQNIKNFICTFIEKKLFCWNQPFYSNHLTVQPFTYFCVIVGKMLNAVNSLSFYCECGTGAGAALGEWPNPK